MNQITFKSSAGSAVAYVYGMSAKYSFNDVLRGDVVNVNASTKSELTRQIKTYFSNRGIQATLSR